MFSISGKSLVKLIILLWISTDDVYSPEVIVDWPRKRSSSTSLSWERFASEKVMSKSICERVFNPSDSLNLNWVLRLVSMTSSTFELSSSFERYSVINSFVSSGLKKLFKTSSTIGWIFRNCLLYLLLNILSIPQKMTRSHVWQPACHRPKID